MPWLNWDDIPGDWDDIQGNWDDVGFYENPSTQGKPDIFRTPTVEASGSPDIFRQPPAEEPLTWDEIPGNWDDILGNWDEIGNPP